MQRLTPRQRRAQAKRDEWNTSAIRRLALEGYDYQTDLTYCHREALAEMAWFDTLPRQTRNYINEYGTLP